MSIERFELYPLPPPWRYDKVELIYVNDDNGEVSTIHPYQRLLDKRAAEASGGSSASVASTSGNVTTTKVKVKETGTSEGKESYPQDGLGYMREDSSDGPLFIGEVEGTSLVVTNNTEASDTVNNAQQQSVATSAPSAPSAPIDPKTLKLKMKGMKYSDFRCVWRELNLMGETNAYGITIRYYPDGQTVIKFDGVDGSWFFSQMYGPYGPIDRYDLFVGAKVTVFGRHLTISAAGASQCHWIEEEGARLSKQQEWLQQRVESVGAVCCVKRAPPQGPLQHNGRSSKPAGGINLRWLQNGNNKLLEQLATLGMSHCTPPLFWTKEHKIDTELNFYTV
jgi:hypothetical protein